jgi:tetratricopeptide (TPR) repeat protein
MKRLITIAIGIIAVVVAVFVFSPQNQLQGGSRRYISDIGRAHFFTDNRPFDKNLVDEDINILTNSLAKNPNDVQSLVSRGFIYAALTDFDGAMSDFQKAVKIDPNADTGDPYAPIKNQVYYLLALTEWQSGRTQDAVKDFSRVIEADGTHARTYFYRGMASLELGDRSSAVKDIEAASRMDNPAGGYPDPMAVAYPGILDEIEGRPVRERIVSSYVMCFLSNKPPQLRPFGYVWEIQHKVAR